MKPMHTLKFTLFSLCLPLLFWSLTAFAAEPCTTATPTCTEMAAPASSKERTLVYRTQHVGNHAQTFIVGKGRCETSRATS